MFCRETSLYDLRSKQRSISRTINTVRKDLNRVLSQTASDDNVSSAAALLKSWKTELDDLKDVVNDILEATDYEGKTDKEVEVLETETSKEYVNLKMDYPTVKGRFSAILRSFSVKYTNQHSMKLLKYYAALFMCFATHATHIENVSNFTTKSFIATPQRFSVRHCIPNSIWSINSSLN